MNAKCKIVQQLYYDFVLYHKTATNTKRNKKWNKVQKSTYAYEYVVIFAQYTYTYTYVYVCRM